MFCVFALSTNGVDHYVKAVMALQISTSSCTPDHVDRGVDEGFSSKHMAFWGAEDIFWFIFVIIGDTKHKGRYKFADRSNQRSSSTIP